MIMAVTLEEMRKTMFSPFADSEAHLCLTYLIRWQTASPG